MICDYLTWAQKLTSSQLSPPHDIKLKIIKRFNQTVEHKKSENSEFVELVRWVGNKHAMHGMVEIVYGTGEFV